MHRLGRRGLERVSHAVPALFLKGTAGDLLISLGLKKIIEAIINDVLVETQINMLWKNWFNF